MQHSNNRGSLCGATRRCQSSADCLSRPLALKDFKKISKNADELLFLSKEEEWKVLSTPGYERYSNEFRRNAQAIIKNAEEEDLDACARSYTDMNLTCVNCHKHVREVRMGQLPRGPNRLTVSTPSSE